MATEFPIFEVEIRLRVRPGFTDGRKFDVAKLCLTVFLFTPSTNKN